MSKVAKALLILGGAALATVAVLQSAFAGPAVNYSQEIYKLTLTAPGAASSVPEWTSLRTGAWRADVEGQAGRRVAADEDGVRVARLRQGDGGGFEAEVADDRLGGRQRQDADEQAEGGSPGDQRRDGTRILHGEHR